MPDLQAAFPSTLNQLELPRRITSSAPVSDTGCPGAKPGEGANLFSIADLQLAIWKQNNKEQTPIKFGSSRR